MNGRLNGGCDSRWNLRRWYWTHDECVPEDRWKKTNVKKNQDEGVEVDEGYAKVVAILYKW